MSNQRSIRQRIASIISTKKITRAMQMVAVAKLRKVKDARNFVQPYLQNIGAILDRLRHSEPGVDHAFLAKDNFVSKKPGIVVISSNRGLAGGLNYKLYKMVWEYIEKLEESGMDYSLYLYGQKAQSAFNTLSSHIKSMLVVKKDIPLQTDLIGLTGALKEDYLSGSIDSVFVGFNEFVNTMQQTPRIDRVLPFCMPEKLDGSIVDYIYEPTPVELLDALLQRYFESKIYGGVIENCLSEQAARMIAMQSATENAEQLIDDLKLDYNKARQSSITKELAEIVSGAQAIN